MRRYRYRYWVSVSAFFGTDISVSAFLADTKADTYIREILYKFIQYFSQKPEKHIEIYKKLKCFEFKFLNLIKNWNKKTIFENDPSKYWRESAKIYPKLKKLKQKKINLSICIGIGFFGGRYIGIGIGGGVVVSVSAQPADTSIGASLLISLFSKIIYYSSSRFYNWLQCDISGRKFEI